MRRVMIVGVLALLAIPAVSRAQGQTETPRAALAYVWQNTVTLADATGNAVNQPGPTFTYGQGARLFWTPDAGLLYIARDDGLYAASADGGPAVQPWLELDASKLQGRVAAMPSPEDALVPAVQTQLITEMCSR